MNIVEVTTISISQYTFVLPIAEHLRADGHRVTMICHDERREEGSSFVDLLRERGFEVVVVPMSRRISPFVDLAAVWRIYRFLRTAKVDLLRAQTAKAGMIARLAARLARVPHVVYTAHAWSFHDLLPLWKQRLYAALERAASRFCDVILVDSEVVRRRGLAFNVAPPEKIRVIPMGIDVDRFSPEKVALLRDDMRQSLRIAADAPVIGAAARFVPDKGLECFVEAAASIVKEQPECVFVMVGDGPLRPLLERMIAERNLQASFRLVGMQSEMVPYYAVMDVFMLPSLREGFGVAYAEAMSCGLPVIATNIAPMTDIILGGENGLFAEPNDAEGFARAALQLVGSPELRRRMGASARQRVVSAFSVSLMIAEHAALFASLVGGDPRRSEDHAAE